MCETLKVQEREVGQVPLLERNNFMCEDGLGPTDWKVSWQIKCPRGPARYQVDHEPAMCSCGK